MGFTPQSSCSLSTRVIVAYRRCVQLLIASMKLNVFNEEIMSSCSCSPRRQHKLYNKELYADFIAAQIKTLSFLAYIIRIYQVQLPLLA